MVINIKRLNIAIFLSLAIWGQSIHLFVLPGVGMMYPLRVVLLAYSFYFFIVNVVTPKRSTKTDRMLLLFFIYSTIVTVLNKKWDSTSLYSISMVTILLMVSCMIRLIKSEEDRYVSLKTIIVNALVLYLLAIYENQTYSYLFSANTPTQYSQNAFGTLQPILFFGNTNNLCMFFCMTLPCLFLVTNNRIARILWTMATIHVALITSCRTGFVLVIIFYALIVFFRLQISRPIRIVTLISSVIICMITIIYGNIELNVRVYLWVNALYNSCRTFFLGTGLGSSRYVNAEHTIFNIVKEGYFGGYTVGAVHNYLLELLLETGLIGIGTLFIWAKDPIKYVVKNKSNNRGFIYFCILVFTGFTSVCVSTMTQWFQLWIFFPIVFSYAFEGISKKQEDSKSVFK